MDNISFSNDSVCSICLENLDFQIKNSTIKTHCNHCFHNNCLEQWLNNHSTCPYCRFSIRESNYDSDDDLPDLEPVHHYVDDVYVFTLLNNNNTLNNMINMEINNNNILNNMINEQINNLMDRNIDSILFNEIINEINNINTDIINININNNNSINNTNNYTYIDNTYDDLPELELIQQT
jgi:hypothetical protein